MEVSQVEYNSIRQKRIQGRYVTYEHISEIVETLPSKFPVETIGFSVKDIPIKAITVGSGPKKIFMWSQMHGNESTTTKAVFDLLNFLGSNSLFENCTIKIIPILNPDGAKAYTRINANKIDLNRDAIDQSQPESRILREYYEKFNPDFCFNLHDQRTIFNVGNAQSPATLSFLAPAHDDIRSISSTRELSMQLIAAMNEQLQKLIPGQVGRYDDAFNPNCIGDTFQMQGTPTILFEAGHFQEDYEREQTRFYVFYALLTALRVISNDGIHHFGKEDYFAIPENSKLFYDILIHNVHVIDSSTYSRNDSVGILFKEELKSGNIVFKPTIEKTGDLDGCYGHKSYDCNNTSDLKIIKKLSFWEDL